MKFFVAFILPMGTEWTTRLIAFYWTLFLFVTDFPRFLLFLSPLLPEKILKKFWWRSSAIRKNFANHVGLINSDLTIRH